MGTVLLRGKLRDGLYLLHYPRTTANSQSKIIKPVSHLVNSCNSVVSLAYVKHDCTSICFFVSASSLSSNVWHQRLDHPFAKVLRQVLNLCNSSRNKNLEFCSACQYGKSHVLPFFVSKPKLLHFQNHTLIFGGHHQFLEALVINITFILSMILPVSHGFTLLNTNCMLLLLLNNSNFLWKSH